MIITKDLQKSFGGNQVLRGINEHIEKGEKVVIIGPSGSGKSTFLRCLNLLEEPTGGEIWFEGNNITDKGTDINKLRQKMGMVFQQFNLFPHMTVKENITLAPVQLGIMNREEAEKKALELLKRVGLPEKAEQYPKQLSGGQKQRLCIARALLKNPKILILDDSTSAVDTRTDYLIRKAFREDIPDITKLIISQRISSIEDADRIVVLDDGKINGIGTHAELLKTNEIYQEVYRTQVKGGDENAD